MHRYIYMLRGVSGRRMRARTCTYGAWYKRAIPRLRVAYSMMHVQSGTHAQQSLSLLFVICAC